MSPKSVELQERARTTMKLVVFPGLPPAAVARGDDRLRESHQAEHPPPPLPSLVSPDPPAEHAPPPNRVSSFLSPTPPTSTGGEQRWRERRRAGRLSAGRPRRSSLALDGLARATAHLRTVHVLATREGRGPAPRATRSRQPSTRHRRSREAHASFEPTSQPSGSLVARSCPSFRGVFAPHGGARADRPAEESSSPPWAKAKHPIPRPASHSPRASAPSCRFASQPRATR